MVWWNRVAVAVWSVAIAPIIGGCVRTPPHSDARVSAPVRILSADWAEYCYDGLAEDVDSLASSGADDCGLYASPSKADQKSAQACMRVAVAAGRPFKTGYVSFGFDSAYCDILVRKPDGQFISLFYDFDVTGQAGSDGGNSALWARRCRGISYKPGTMGAGSFFDTKDCAEAKDIADALIAAHTGAGK